jgi:hypothetical protein
LCLFFLKFKTNGYQLLQQLLYLLIILVNRVDARSEIPEFWHEPGGKFSIPFLTGGLIQGFQAGIQKIDVLITPPLSAFRAR